MADYTTIMLLGPKHSGKTTTGTALAKLLGIPFIDLDEAIEQSMGRSPRELYREGADVFRQAEAETLLSVIRQDTPQAVIAAGGGIIDNEQALALLMGQKRLLGVYLAVSTETAWQRISASTELPPFLETENPQETHRLLHERRAAAYQALADCTISGEGKAPEAVAEEIRNYLLAML